MYIFYNMYNPPIVFKVIFLYNTIIVTPIIIVTLVITMYSQFFQVKFIAW